MENKIDGLWEDLIIMQKQIDKLQNELESAQNTIKQKNLLLETMAVQIAALLVDE